MKEVDEGHLLKAVVPPPTAFEGDKGHRLEDVAPPSSCY